MSKNEMVAMIETMNNYDELAAKAKAKADAIREAIKDEMLRLNTEELTVFCQVKIPGFAKKFPWYCHGNSLVIAK